MNPDKRDYNGWILCPSTRFLGKCYYFNPATGEAVWNLSDMEKRMVSQPNFTHSEKWHAYPEPDCPPEDTSNPWGYQPDCRVFPQASPPFGQAVFPKYTPNAMDMFPTNIPWGMPGMQQSVYMPPMMPMYNPMSQSWANFRANQKQFMQEKSFFSNNTYMQKVPYYNQGMNRQVFGAKPKPNNFPVFSQMNSQNREVMKKRPHPATENGNDKEPLFKRLRSQNENIFGASNNPFRTRSIESPIPEKVCKPFRMPEFQQENSSLNHCNCMLSRSNGNSNMSSQFPKSRENSTNIGKPKEHIFKPAELKSPTSLESPLKPPSEVSSNFSLQNSFVFPLTKSDSKISSAKSLSLVKKLQNSTVSQSGQDNKKVQSESLDSKLSETDLRYILMARRKKSSLTDLQETSKCEKVEVKKIKTSYSENNKFGDSLSKKHVTFDLGVEDIIPDDNPDADTAYGTDNVDAVCEAEVAKHCYVSADMDALLAEFELIEEFIKSDESYTLLIPARIARDIEAMCGELGDDARRRVLAARHITRHIARHTHIQVQPEDPEAGAGVPGDPSLNCCLKVFDEGQLAILITNNEELYDKATSYEIECYTTEDIKQVMATPKPEVSFDIQKVGNTVTGVATDNSEPASIPVNCSREKMFENTCNQFFLKKQPENCDDEKIQLKRQINVNDRTPFFDKDDDLLEETQFKIENLKLQEKIDTQKNRDREALAAKKTQDTEKENLNVFKNGDEAKEDYLAARKKLKSINVYNMDGLLKSFNIKSKDMEERIMMRMDEYVCIFCQIMEAIFLDVVEHVPTHMCEDFTKSPVQNLLASLREVFADDRTARALADKLSMIMDGAFVRDDVHGRLLLALNPNEFVKMFACGTLLVEVLRNILPNNATLEEGEVLLEQLEHSLERWDTEPQPNTPVTPGAGAEPRPEYVKKPSEVLLFLTKHYPEWQSYNTTGNHNQTYIDKQKINAEVPDKTTAKVVRTFGRNLGLLKLGTGTALNFSNHEENKDKENNIKVNDNNKKEAKKADAKEENKPKILRKLAIESLNLPPKFKEIDVEKRENDDKELTQMLDQMITKQPLTKRYDLNSIIINKDDNNMDKLKMSKNDEKINFHKDFKLKVKIVTTTKTNLHTKNMTIDNDVENTAPKKCNDEEKINTVDINKNALDLDVLDYSDFEESFIQEREESIVESDHCNDVTTTHNDLDDSSPNNEKNNQNNYLCNDSDSGNNNNNDTDNEDCDSGIESYQMYSCVQLFLMTLSKTFIMIKQFIEASVIDLRKAIDEKSGELLNQKAGTAHGKVKNIIKNLSLIIDRESNPKTAVTTLMKGNSEVDTDKRMTKYRRVVSKCLTQARVLERSLLILQRIAHRDFLMRDISDVADNYSNLFE